MRRLIPYFIALCMYGQPAATSVFDPLTIARFKGSGKTTIQGIATDFAGNTYVAGTTTAPDLPAPNGFQPRMGESRIVRTFDGGATWNGLGDPPLDPWLIVPDPAAPEVLFITASTGIYRSADGGQSWSAVYQSPLAFPQGGSLVIDPGNHLRLAALGNFSNAGLVLSTDGGETWNEGQPPCSSGDCGGSLLADPTGSGFLLSLTDAGVHISRDWGGSFQSFGPSPGATTAVAFVPAKPGWIYAATIAYDFGPNGVVVNTTANVVLTTDYGATWTRESVPQSPLYSFDPRISQLVIDPDQPSTLFASTRSHLYKSTDGAASWVSVALPADAPVNNLTALGRSCGGGLFGVASITFGNSLIATEDSGSSWQFLAGNRLTDLAAGPGCSLYASRTMGGDVFVAKYARDGSELWATYLGGSDADIANGIAVDAAGAVYVTGITESPDFPVTRSRIGPSGSFGAFLAKYTPDGQRTYSVVFGGVSGGIVSTIPSAIAIDCGGNAFVVGNAGSPDFPVTGGAWNPQYGCPAAQPFCGTAGFIAKFGPDASLIYASFIRSPSAVLVNSSGEATIAGTGQIPGQPASVGSNPGYVLRLDATGSQLVSAAYLPGGAAGLATDTQENLYISGTTYATDFPITPGAYVSPLHGQTCSGLVGPFSPPPRVSRGDVYVMKLRSSDWQTIYAALLGGRCGSSAGGIVADVAGGVAFEVNASPDFPLSHPLLSTPGTEQAMLVAKLSADGSTLLFSTYLDGVAPFFGSLLLAPPPIALAADGALLAGVSATDSASIVRLPPDGTSVPANLGRPPIRLRRPIRR